MPNPLLDIRIGTMVRANLDDPAAYVRQILPLGFESIQPFFWQTLGGKDIPRLASMSQDMVRQALDAFVRRDAALARTVIAGGGEAADWGRRIVGPGHVPPYFSSTRASGASLLIRSIPLWQSALFL